MAARDVDAYLTGTGTQLPVSGGIVKRVPYNLARKAISEEPAKVAAVKA